MIYLDNAATTRPDPKALSQAETYYSENYFNPSARYGGGFAVRRAVEEAREELLALIAGEGYELEFTSGGTEADNHAVLAAKRGNAVTTKGEHAAVYESFVHLRERGTEPRFAAINRDGSVDPASLLSLVDEKTSLVSVVHVNNETGAVNDIASLAREVKKKNPRCLFHSDGVQAFGKIPFRLSPAIDLYSVSAHKIGGLKGTGALYKRKGIALPPLIFGGGQEEGQRSGTENVLGILDFLYAASAKFQTLEKDYAALSALRGRIQAILSESGLFTAISPAEGSPYLLTVASESVRGEVIQRMLFDRGVAVGTGSACSSKKPYSRILEACGYSRAALGGVIRLSFCPQTGEEALDAAKLLAETAEEYRRKVSL